MQQVDCERFSGKTFVVKTRPHAVGPEGRLIDPKSLSFGLLCPGGKSTSVTAFWVLSS